MATGVPLTLSKFFMTKKMPKKFSINFQIKEAITDEKFKITDGNGIFDLVVSDMKPQWKKYFRPGRFAKIIMPKLDKTLGAVTMGENSILLQGRSIEGLDQTPTLDKTFAPISSTFELDKHQHVSWSIIGKVAEKYEGKFRNTSFLKLGIKDINGNKNSVSIWKQNLDYSWIDLNMVLIFKNLKTDKYPQTKPFHLSTKMGSVIELAPSINRDEYASVKIFDGEIDGKIAGFNNFIPFRCCSECKKSIGLTKIGSKCPICSKIVENILHNFSVNLIINGEEEFVTLLCFKSNLSFEPSKEDNGDASESELREKFEDCTVSATFNNKQNKETGMIQKHVQTLHIM